MASSDAAPSRKQAAGGWCTSATDREVADGITNASHRPMVTLYITGHARGQWLEVGKS